MATLLETLTREDTRPRVVRACVDLVDTEVESKRGLSGIAIKAAYKLVQAVKPTFVRDVVDRLLPEFAGTLEPLYVESIGLAEHSGKARAETFSTHLQGNADRAADALLAVTDSRVNATNNLTLRKTYEKLRGTAQEHVQAAVPNLARTIAPFV